MSKFLSHLFLIVAGIGVLLGNMWFTYGIWPKDWLSFFGFAVLSVTLMAFRLALDKEK